MSQSHTTKQKEHEKSTAQLTDSLQIKKDADSTQDQASEYHLLGPGIICDTGPRGYTTPHGRSLQEIVVDASEGFIPLWTENTHLRWRFQKRSMEQFKNPEAAMKEIRLLFGESLLAWGSAAPVKFTENNDTWDFEIVMRKEDDCNINGCVLAKAFFPDSGRHELILYPRMFAQSRKEQIDTFTHELGHVFGLRHFFADVSETAWPSEIFGTHSKFSIMNYGSLSELTATDKDDLRQLYQQAWKGTLTEINGTPIRFVKPYHTYLLAADSVFNLHHVMSSHIPQPSLIHDGKL